ncbi:MULTISPECIES: DUF1294 domain-containing protein [unclassified Devosia]|uniref:DUF1294 domain-containing protein n=1 Tax=unclassified Devosia TaxID=196773 RepID=UPI0015517F69|nr:MULTISPECIES: DUF1294 domain-containing protein [unclassified Devosia]
MQRSGVLVEWNDRRGFGFIDGGDGSRCFVHVSAIAGPTRPQVGDHLRYRLGPGRDGRPQAMQVQLASAKPAPRVPRASIPSAEPASLGWRSGAAIILAALLAVALFRGSVPLPLGGIYILASILAFSFYHHDKQAAKAGEWRVSEATLHALDLGCGIIGGLLSQERFRHKTRKAGFIAFTFVIAAMHLLWLGGLATGLITTAELTDLLSLWP